MKIKTVYCYDRNKEWTARWKSYLPEDFQLVELPALKEMMFYTSSDFPQLLLVREGALRLHEIPVLALISKSFPRLRVVAFNRFDDLKWCVEMMKVPGLRMAQLPERKEDFSKVLRESFDPDLAPDDEHDEAVGGWLENCVRESVEERRPLEKASRTFEREYRNRMVRACGNNLRKAAFYLGVDLGLLGKEVMPHAGQSPA